MHFERLERFAIAERDENLDAPVGIISLAVHLELTGALDARKGLGKLGTGMFNQCFQGGVEAGQNLIDLGLEASVVLLK